jgi:hypothetical protein
MWICSSIQHGGKEMLGGDKPSRSGRVGALVAGASYPTGRIWQKYGLQPHRVETFKFRRDAQFDANLADIVGLHLNPPERALVLCICTSPQPAPRGSTCRALVGADYHTDQPARQLPPRRASRAGHYPLSRQLEPPRPTLPLDQTRSPDYTQHPRCCTYLPDVTLERCSCQAPARLPVPRIDRRMRR